MYSKELSRLSREVLDRFDREDLGRLIETQIEDGFEIHIKYLNNLELEGAVRCLKLCTEFAMNKPTGELKIKCLLYITLKIVTDLLSIEIERIRIKPSEARYSRSIYKNVCASMCIPLEVVWINISCVLILEKANLIPKLTSDTTKVNTEAIIDFLTANALEQSLAEING